MEIAKIELNAIREAADKVEQVVVELSELELVMVGGGTGDIHLG